MFDKFHQASFQIHKGDNVSVALSDLQPGEVSVYGPEGTAFSAVGELIKQGHKLARRNINEGEAIIKYGVTIGLATRDILVGEWVHLHNCKSFYDKRSSTLDVESGAPTDIQYR
ncbi:UxaA family hydrolase [Paenibacillus sp. UNC451MF]|uniref:UxaA family hydrolase n=1 Tax=Paenibacillus sp. UNC451MF TaxID=1449063 RepID=UPI00048B87AC|nr:UxaA family hydrolase [Paenibacillus sp. UNC451MF]